MCESLATVQLKKPGRNEAGPEKNLFVFFFFGSSLETALLVQSLLNLMNWHFLIKTCCFDENSCQLWDTHYCLMELHWPVGARAANSEPPYPGSVALLVLCLARVPELPSHQAAAERNSLRGSQVSPIPCSRWMEGPGPPLFSLLAQWGYQSSVSPEQFLICLLMLTIAHFYFCQQRWCGCKWTRCSASLIISKIAS